MGCHIADLAAGKLWIKREGGAVVFAAAMLARGRIASRQGLCHNSTSRAEYSGWRLA
jgi:hypothetical protein